MCLLFLFNYNNVKIQNKNGTALAVPQFLND